MAPTGKTLALRTAVGAFVVPRVARATETESGVEVLGYAPIKAVSLLFWQAGFLPMQ